MSVATISYASLSAASGEAKDVADRLGTYADNLKSNVYNKLNKYKGDHTGNIGSAMGNTSAKINSLREKESAFRAYSRDLDELEGQCRSKDQAVKSKISKLTADFKKANGIKNSKVQNWINYHLTGFKNSSSAGRWVNDKTDESSSIKEYIRQCFEDWWDYEGGKQLVKGVLIAAATIAIAVITILNPASGVLAVIAAVIGIVNGVVNIVNECRAYYQTTANDDPAMGRRRSDENTMQDTLRKETDSTFLHGIATGIDITLLVCTVADIIGKAGKLLKNGYKWATDSTKQLGEISCKDIFTKNTWTKFWGKTGAKWNEIKTAFKMKDVMYFKNVALDFKTDFLNNLKDNFLNFEGDEALSSTKNIISAFKGFLENGINFGSIIKELVIPGIALGQITTLKPNSSGQMQFDFDNIKLDDITGLGEKIYDKVIDNSLFKNEDIVNVNIKTEVLEKLSSRESFSIKVPEISFPKNSTFNMTGVVAYG